MKMIKWFWSCVIVIISGGLFLMADGLVKPDKSDTPNKSEEKSGTNKTTDDDLDELQNELKPEPVPEEKDIIELLKEIETKMTEAADGLSCASAWESLNDQEKTILSIDEIIKRQKEAREKLDKLFQDTKDKQKEAVDTITELLKLAREQEFQQNQQKSQESKPSQPQPRPTVKPSDTSKQPATAPYETKSHLPPDGENRSGDASKRWGDLPPKLREAILQSTTGEFLPEYKQKLEKYFKILAGENEKK